MTVWATVSVLAGLVVLVVGANALVRGAARLAVIAGVSPLVIGLTVVAYGTSAPELAVSVHAAMTGAPEVSVGNAVGSNIFNVLVVLGVSALVGGLVVQQRIVRIDVPILVVVTAAVWWLAADGSIGTGEGLVLVAGIVAYSGFSFVFGRRESREVADEYDRALGAVAAPASQGWPRAVGLVVAGLVALVVGAQLLVTGATDLATGLGVSDLVIGLTVVAAGTSLPELSTSVVAALRGERDIAVGNVVGSNVFNLLGVLGVAAVAGGGIPVQHATIVNDLPVAVLVTVIALPALASGLVVARWEGALLLAAYGGYIGHLVLDATGSPITPAARVILLAGLAAMAAAITLIGVALARRAAGAP